MRRFAFYLSVALLAFGIGSFVVFKFYFKHAEQPVIAQTAETNTVSKPELKDNTIQREMNENKVDDTKETVLKNLPCKDKNLRLVWDKIKNEFADETFEDLADRGVRSCKDLFEVEKVIDLNGDKQVEIVVHQIADCPASGNCTFWVFQKEKNDFKPILDTNMIQSFNLRKTQTNGYKDLELRTWNTGFEYYVQLFKFNAGKYKAQKCWFETHQILGKFLKKPKITLEECSDYDYVN